MLNDRSHQYHVDWNPARVARLKVLYFKGLSFGLIADDIGVTRNAAISKARRLRLPPRSPATERMERPQRTSSVRAAKPANGALHPQRELRAGHAKIQTNSAPKFNTRHRCTFADLTEQSCRFPLWEDGEREQLFCGTPEANIATGISYCRYHQTVCGPTSNDVHGNRVRSDNRVAGRIAAR